jgi:predicted RNA-binding Zn-ribbon protein involved in translation (DUF1610 family)
MKPKGLKETIDRHQIIEHPCPKCGTEMAKIDDEDFTDENELRNFGTYWVCSSCGHEEKVGEKRHWDDGSPGGVTGGEKK